MKQTARRGVGAKDGNILNRAALVLPRASGLGALIAIGVVIGAIVAGVLNEGEPAAIVPATVGVLFYVGVPAVIFGAGTAFLACFVAVIIHDVLVQAHCTPTMTRWLAAACAALLAVWPTVLCLRFMDVSGAITLVLVAASAVVSTYCGSKLLRRLAT